ncbi:hypothetical protein L2E82_05292 [Cichorium intybus]|uniref:Uncharacterized protein n=1 Tax=Cichorium intybus TaxID=13427 RepID=A0ACB9H716_CICIN|nr:hypothetical protein L2E82_05292 [Cichorium intybus]
MKERRRSERWPWKKNKDEEAVGEMKKWRLKEEALKKVEVDRSKMEIATPKKTLKPKGGVKWLENPYTDGVVKFWYKKEELMRNELVVVIWPICLEYWAKLEEGPHVLSCHWGFGVDFIGEYGVEERWLVMRFMGLEGVGFYLVLHLCFLKKKHDSGLEE